MKYKTEYPQAYAEGVINKSVTLSRVAVDLLELNEIDNSSAFINDLLIDALQEKDFFKKKLISQITNARETLKQKYGIETNFEVEK